MNVTLIIPTIPGREEQLRRAVESAQSQSRPADDILVYLDDEREGAGPTRNRALANVDTDWVAFLDDDDELKPNHLRACARHAWLTGADIVYPGYDTIGDDPIGCFGIPFDPVLLRQRNYIPVTVLARTDLVRDVGGFRDHPDEYGERCEDWGLWLALLDAGAKFSHLAQRTWIWDCRRRYEEMMAVSDASG